MALIDIKNKLESLMAHAGRVSAVLTKYRLDRLVLLGGFADNTVRIRLVW